MLSRFYWEQTATFLFCARIGELVRSLGYPGLPPPPIIFCAAEAITSGKTFFLQSFHRLLPLCPNLRALCQHSSSRMPLLCPIVNRVRPTRHRDRLGSPSPQLVEYVSDLWAKDPVVLKVAGSTPVQETAVPAAATATDGAPAVGPGPGSMVRVCRVYCTGIVACANGHGST